MPSSAVVSPSLHRHPDSDGNVSSKSHNDITVLRRKSSCRSTTRKSYSGIHQLTRQDINVSNRSSWNDKITIIASDTNVSMRSPCNGKANTGGRRHSSRNDASNTLLDDFVEIEVPALLSGKSVERSCPDVLRPDVGDSKHIEDYRGYQRSQSNIELTNQAETIRQRRSSSLRTSINVIQTIEAEKNVKDALQKSSNPLMRSFFDSKDISRLIADDEISATSATEQDSSEESSRGGGLVAIAPSARRSGVFVEDADVTSGESPDSNDVLIGIVQSFEEFIVRTAERHRRRSIRLKQQQSIAMLFTCTDLIKTDYASVVSSYSNSHSPDADIVDINLHASSHIVYQFLNVLDILNESDNLVLRTSDGMCYSRLPSQVVYSDMEKLLLDQLSAVTAGIKFMTPLQASKMVCWYENYLQTLREVCPDKDKVKASGVWTVDIKRLLERYLEFGVRREIKELIMKINQNRSAACAGQPTVTSLPEEIVYVVDVQLEVASGHLPEKYVPNVLEVCNEVLSQITCDNMMQIEMNWQSINATQFCSLINDVTRLHELLQERNKYFFLKFSPNKGEEELTHVKVVNQCSDNILQVQEKARNLENQLAELPLHANEYLCRHIIHKLQHPEPILNSIGHISWENDSNTSIVSRTVAILREYFKIFEISLYADSFFPKVLKKCFNFTLQTYIESFYENTMTFGVKSPEVIARNLRLDYQVLTKFFNSRVFAKHTSDAGILSSREINERLYAIQNMSRIIDTDISPLDLLDDVRAIIERVSVSGTSNVTAVLHIAGLRGSQSMSDSIKWIQTISCAESDLMADRRSCDLYCIQFPIKLPDLTNSPYLYRAFRYHRNTLIICFKMSG
jgi:hypothetical protein